MTLWQRVQFWSLGQQADVVGFSIQPWADRYQSWFSDSDVEHWPVGSNIPKEEASHSTARRHLGISESTFVAGVFGTLRSSRLVDWIRRAVGSLGKQSEDFLLLYVGPDGDTLRKEITSVQIRDAGALPAPEVSLHLAGMDLHLSPFTDGASTRRGSFLAGLQHGVPTVSTHGPLTDALLYHHAGQAFLLTPHDDPAEFERAVIQLYHECRRRLEMGSVAQRFFDKHFRWSAIAGKVLKSLRARETESTMA
jgi:glycosyltransferase involved in cell wall biosynthesis